MINLNLLVCLLNCVNHIELIEFKLLMVKSYFNQLLNYVKKFFSKYNRWCMLQFLLRFHITLMYHIEVYLCRPDKSAQKKYILIRSMFM